MSKTNNTSSRHYDTLADSELNAVTGGTKTKGSGSFFEALAQAWGKALDEQAARVQQ